MRTFDWDLTNKEAFKNELCKFYNIWVKGIVIVRYKIHLNPLFIWKCYIQYNVIF